MSSQPNPARRFASRSAQWRKGVRRFRGAVGAYLTVRFSRVPSSRTPQEVKDAVLRVVDDFLMEAGIGSWRPRDGPLLAFLADSSSRIAWSWS